jgi:hypothetical protein
MTPKACGQHATGRVGLDPIESASPEELRALQLERLRWSLAHAYTGNPRYRSKFEAARVHPADLRSLEDLARFPFTHKADLRAAYPFDFFAVPHERVARIRTQSLSGYADGYAIRGSLRLRVSLPGPPRIHASRRLSAVLSNGQRNRANHAQRSHDDVGVPRPPRLSKRSR